MKCNIMQQGFEHCSCSCALSISYAIVIPIYPTRPVSLDFLFCFSAKFMFFGLTRDLLCTKIHPRTDSGVVQIETTTNPMHYRNF